MDRFVVEIPPQRNVAQLAQTNAAVATPPPQSGNPRLAGLEVNRNISVILVFFVVGVLFSYLHYHTGFLCP